MKKLFLVVMLGWGLIGPAWSDPIEFGVRGGATMANQVFSLPYPTSQITKDVLFGFTGGLFVDFGLNDFLSLQPESSFTMKGFRQNAQNLPVINQYGQLSGTASGSWTYSLNYLEFPVLLKAHASLGGHITGSLSAGPSFETLLSANEHYSVAGVTGNHGLNGAGWDWGVMFGAGLEVDRFLFDLRYDLGLSSVYSNDPQGPTNSVLSLELGYRIL